MCDVWLGKLEFPTFKGEEGKDTNSKSCLVKHRDAEYSTLKREELRVVFPRRNHQRLVLKMEICGGTNEGMQKRDEGNERGWWFQNTPMWTERRDHQRSWLRRWEMNTWKRRWCKGMEEIAEGWEYKKLVETVARDEQIGGETLLEILGDGRCGGVESRSL